MPALDATESAPRAPVSELPGDLLSSLLASDTGPSDRPSRLNALLSASTVRDAIAACFGSISLDGAARDPVRLGLSAAIAGLDDLLTEQVDAVLHAKPFQKLEASWRGLKHLVEQTPDGANVKIRVLPASWAEVVRDQDRALEFDQSVLFKKVYGDEYDTPGGEPFGLLVVDAAVTHRPFPDHPTDDIAALRGLSGVAAAAFAPLVCGTDPRFFGVDSFGELDCATSVVTDPQRAEYVKWQSFRKSEDARFVGMTLPRILLREQYGPDAAGSARFVYRESVTASLRESYLWGNSAYALAGVAVRAFAEYGWLANIRGVHDRRGGLVRGLPAIADNGSGGQAIRSVIDWDLTDMQEKDVGDLGLIPLCHRPGTAEAVFYSVPSAQKPAAFDDPVATANARLGSQLQYILCVSRIAHYLKVLIRDRIGSFSGPAECEVELQEWLQRYVVTNDSASDELKAKHPLREGRVEVKEVPGRPGSYRCTVHLRPHYQLEQLSAAIRLTTQLNS